MMNDLKRARRRLVCALAAWVGVCLVVLSAVVPAQGTWYGGFSHTALGSAVLQVQPGASGNELVVTNIGSSGQDGVTLDLGQAAGIMMEGPVHLIPVGSSVAIAPEGWALSSLVELVVVRGMRNSIGDLELTVDFGQTGATAFDVEIVSQGCVVFQATGLPGPVAAVIGALGGGARQVSVTLKEDLPGVNEIVYTWTLEAPASIGLPGFPFPTGFGDEIRVTPNTAVPDALATFSLTGTDSAPMIITAERLQYGTDHPLWADFWHRALGPTRFDTNTCAECLRLHQLDAGPSNLPKYGFGMNPGGLNRPAASVAMTWNPIDPLGNLPIGASVTWKAVGRLGGQTGEELASTTSTKISGGWDTVVDWTPLQPASRTIEVWNGETQVLSIGGLGAPISWIVTDAPEATSFDIGDPVSMTGTYPDNSPITVMVGGSPITVSGDRVVVKAIGLAGEPEVLARLDLFTDAISELTLTSAEVAALPFSLAFSQDPTTLTVDLAIEGATPASPYFINYSFDPLNGIAPGTGPWGGLWITVPELLSQLDAGAWGVPMFGGTLDACGQVETAITGLPSLPGLTFWSVALTFDETGAWVFSDVGELGLL